MSRELLDKQSELDRLKTEIEEFNRQKSNLVRDINVQLIEAHKQADEIVNVAKTQAQGIIDSANKYKSDTESVADNIKKEATDLLHTANSNIEGLKKAQEELIKDRVDFENLKSGQETNIKIRIGLLRESEDRVSVKTEELNGLEENLRQRESVLRGEEQKLKEDKESFARIQEKIIADRKELDSKIEEYKQMKLSLEAAKEENAQVTSANNAERAKISLDIQTNQKLKEDLEKQSLSLIEQRKSISVQFDLISNNQRELEERKISLDEREQLIMIKDRDVESKIRVLQELRLKK